MKLSNIASVHSGVYTNTISDGEVYYIQARDFDANRQLVNYLKPTLSYTSNIEKHLLIKGDVLIVAKGASFLAAVYNGRFSPAVASTVFMVIRLKNKKEMRSDYLSWLLNQQSTQHHLAALSRGTSIPSINKKILLDLDIPVPSIEKQEVIAKIATLNQKEKSIYQELITLKEQKLNQIIKNAITH